MKGDLPWFERTLRKAVSLRVILLCMIGWIAGTIGFGYLVKYDANSDTAIGRAAEAARAIASIPSVLLAAWRGVRHGQAAGDLPPRPDGFAVRQPRYPTEYLLVSRYSAEQGRFVAILLRAADNKPLRTYAPDIRAINARSRMTTDLIDLKRDRAPYRYRLQHPLLMEDGGIVFQDSSPLVRVDACGRIRWTLDGIFHHSAERGPEGDLWVPYTPPRSPRSKLGTLFRDDGIAHISPDGRIISLTLLTDILHRNGLAGRYLNQPFSDDPFHLNDIEPVFETGPYWQRGDVFLSLRNLSLVVLYRPSTGKVLWHQAGPWRMQHDVSILDDQRIAIFDNRVSYQPDQAVDGANSIVVRDFGDGSISRPYDGVLAAAGVRTVTQGRATLGRNEGAFVEETENGRLLRFGVEGNLLWEYIAADKEGRRQLLAWSRLLDPERDARGIAAARSARCS